MESGSRLIAIDYGIRRTGLAVSDPARIIATALDVVPTEKLLDYLSAYCTKERVDRIIIGMPRRFNNQPSDTAEAIRKFLPSLRERFPGIQVEEVDEQFTTIRAHEAMISGGMKKKDRQVKGAADKISATLILQEYMSRNQIR